MDGQYQTAEQLFFSIQKEFDEKKSKVEELIGKNHHHLSAGVWKETLLREIIATNLRAVRKELRVRTGFIRDGYPTNPVPPSNITTQQDILVVDSYKSKGSDGYFHKDRHGDFVIVRPDIVEAMIEVKSNWNDYKSILEKLACDAGLVRRIRGQSKSSPHTETSRPWVGLFIYNHPPTPKNPDLGQDQDNDKKKLIKDTKKLLKAIKEAALSNDNEDRVIDCLVLGDRCVIRFIEMDGKLGWVAYVYDLVDGMDKYDGFHAQAYFVSQFIWRLIKDKPTQNMDAWFPKTRQQKMFFLPLNEGEIVDLTPK